MIPRGVVETWRSLGKACVRENASDCRRRRVCRFEFTGRGEETRVQPARGGESTSRPPVNSGLASQHAVRQFAASYFVARLPIVSASLNGRAMGCACAGSIVDNEPAGGKHEQTRIRFRFSLENSMKLSVLVFTAIGVLAAQSAAAANVTVTNAWARATMPGQPVSAAYMQIKSDADAKLVGASSPVVPQVEVHEMKMEGDVMIMREVKALDLPKGRTVTLEPGGFHIMLMNLKQPIAAGEVIPLKLVIDSGGKKQTVEVKAEARARNSGAMQNSNH